MKTTIIFLTFFVCSLSIVGQNMPAIVEVVKGERTSAATVDSTALASFTADSLALDDNQEATAERVPYEYPWAIELQERGLLGALICMFFAFLCIVWPFLADKTGGETNYFLAGLAFFLLFIALLSSVFKNISVTAGVLNFLLLIASGFVFLNADDDISEGQMVYKSAVGVYVILQIAYLFAAF